MQKKLSWDELRAWLKTAKLKPGYKCRGCVWSNSESGFILCTKYKCVKEQSNEKYGQFEYMRDLVVLFLKQSKKLIDQQETIKNKCCGKSAVSEGG